MSRRTDRLLGWILILLSGAIFAGIGLVGIPRLLATPSAAEPAAEVAVLPQPTPTDEPLPTAPPPTLQPTVVATDDVQPPTATATSEPIEPTATPELVEPTATPVQVLTGVVVALEQVIMYESASAEWPVGALFEPGAIADAIGRSPNSDWVHIVTASATGWVPAVQVSFEAGSLEMLPESDWVYERPVAEATAVPVVDNSAEQSNNAVAQVQPTQQPSAAEPTAQPVFPTPAPVQSTPWPTNTPVVFPTPVPTNNTEQQQVQPTATPIQNNDQVANAIAWWDINPGTARATGNGTWQVEIVVRVPTSFQYTFDMAYLWRVDLRDRNLGGDDYFVLSLSGMSCGSAVADPLVVRQSGVRMKVVNEFSVEEGPIFISPAC